MASSAHPDSPSETSPRPDNDSARGFASNDPPPVPSSPTGHVEPQINNSSEGQGVDMPEDTKDPIDKPNEFDEAAQSVEETSLPKDDVAAETGADAGAHLDAQRGNEPEPDVKDEPPAEDADLPPGEPAIRESSLPKAGPPQTQEDAEDAKDSTAPKSPGAQAPARDASNVTPSSKKQTNGTIGSVYSGNKIRHLKKEDGVPLWRKDIQLKFLELVFADETPVFTRYSDGKKDLTFADIYVDAMAKSSKTSRVLKEKLNHDRPAALHMAMVCLLVNFGRMNTTLNFFPEMRAQLRTYHPIPSLQAHTDDSSAYKQLQDAPRLKSILKGASEDTDQPGTIEKVKGLPVPRSNPVNLIFVLSQYAPKISELHFFPPRDFFDLVMGPTLSSQSRAKAFLWLMWYYLEGDFSKEAALNNPFGPGLVGEGTNGLPLKVPALEELTEEEADAENLDTPDEIQYGEEKRQERKRILVDDDVLFRYTKRQKKGAQEYASDDQASEDVPGGLHASHLSGGKGERSSFGGDAGSTASTPLNQSSKRGAIDEDEDLQAPGQTLRPRNKRAKRDSSANRTSSGQPHRIVLKTRMDQTPDTASPAPPGTAHPILNQFGAGSPAPPPGSGSRRPRPLTQHQLAIEQNRKQRVDYVLAQRRAEEMKEFRAEREKEVPFARAGRLIRNLPDGYDTDDENSWGKGGICANPEMEEDYGEAPSFYLSVLRKTARRLQRWDWDAIAAGETETWINDLGRTFKVEAWNEVQEPEVPPPAPPPAGKSKGRGGRRKGTRAATEGEKPATGKRGGRASTGGRKRGSGEGKKSRGAAKTSKVVQQTDAPKEDAAVHETSPAPESRLPSPPVAPEHDETKVAPEDGDEEEDLDDVDRELLGEGSGGEEPDMEPATDPAVHRSSPGPGEDSTLALQSRLGDQIDEDGGDDGSSVYPGQDAAPEEDGAHASDTDPMSDEEMASSVAGGNAYPAEETSSMDMDTTGIGGHGDETMVDA